MTLGSLPPYKKHHLKLRTGQPMPVAQRICTPLSVDLWNNLSPQASSMDVHNPHEACGYSYNGCTDGRQPAYECPFVVDSETLNFQLMWRRQHKKKEEKKWTKSPLTRILFGTSAGFTN